MLASAADLVRPVATFRGAGIVEWLGELLLGDIIDMLVRPDARAGHGPAQWRRTADKARAANAPNCRC